MNQITTRLRTIVLFLLVMTALPLAAKVTTGLEIEENHTVDVRKFTASLKWEAPDSRILTRGTAAPDNVSWMSRIRNIPDYMKDFYQNYGVKVQEVLDGGSNFLSDPEGDEDVFHFNGSHSLILRKIDKKIEYTFPTDVDYTDASAKNEYARLAVSDDVEQYKEEVYSFIDYMFMSMSYDFPQAFWIGNYYSWSSVWGWDTDFIQEPGKDSVDYTYIILFTIKSDAFDYRIEQFRTPEAVKNGVTEYNTCVQDILAGVPNSTRYEQVRYLNDWLTKNNAYSSAYASGEFSPIVWSPISALRGTTGDDGPVCEGYSRAFKVLCNKLNIPCMLAVGDAKDTKDSDPESHMWNEVKMNDGQWYAVDVTWDDPLTGSANELKQSGAENEDWLLLGKNDIVSPGLTFAQSHPNSLVFGQSESANWDYDNETLIADTKFDVSTYDVPQVAQFGKPVKVYSLLGVNIGTFESFDQAVSSLESGLYIINGRKVVIK